MASRTRCNICGAPLQATLVSFVSEVSLDQEGRVLGYKLWEGNDLDGYAWDHAAVRVYCENDHDIEWAPPRSFYEAASAAESAQQETQPPQEDSTETLGESLEALLAAGYIAVKRDASGRPVRRPGQLVYVGTEKARCRGSDVTPQPRA